MRLQISKLRYIQQIHFCLLCNVLFMCENHSLYIKSNILVKIIHLSQLFLHILTLKALMKLNVTDRCGSDLNVSMSQYHYSMQYTSALRVSTQQCWVSLKTAAHCRE